MSPQHAFSSFRRYFATLSCLIDMPFIIFLLRYFSLIEPSPRRRFVDIFFSAAFTLILSAFFRFFFS